MKIFLQSPRLPLAIVFALQCVAMPALAQTVTATSTVVDPNLAGGPGGHGSQLNAGSSIIIAAPVATTLLSSYPAVSANEATLPVNDLAGTPAACYSLTNATNENLFVPWNTPIEWSSFLTAIGAAPQLAAILKSLNQSPQPQLTTGTNTGWVGNVSIGLCCPKQTIPLLDALQHQCKDSQGNLEYATVSGSRYEGIAPNGLVE